MCKFVLVFILANVIPISSFAKNLFHFTMKLVRLNFTASLIWVFLYGSSKWLVSSKHRKKKKTLTIGYHPSERNKIYTNFILKYMQKYLICVLDFSELFFCCCLNAFFQMSQKTLVCHQISVLN